MRNVVATIRQALRGEHHDYTEGKIPTAVVLLAIPMILELGLESVFAVVDIFFVSRLGQNAIATVGMTESVITIIYSIAIGLSTGGAAIVARFKHAERAGEATAYAAWMGGRGHQAVATHHVNEGQGDLLVVGTMILAGTGFRTDPRAHDEVEAMTGMPVVSLELVDPRFYHLDTALTVLDDTTIAYYPPAFTAGSRALLQQLFPDAIEVSSTDAYVLGLNAVSDGRHVVHPAQAVGFAEQLYHAGFHPIGVDLSELLKGGGSVKCCTLEVFS